MTSHRNQKIRWGIIGPGSIAKAFRRRRRRLAHRHARRDRHARSEQGRPCRRLSRALASSTATMPCSPTRRSTRSTSRRRIRPRRMGDQGGRGGQACACRKADGAHSLRGRRDDPCARKAGTFAGEAFMYRLHPQTAKLVELIGSGAIGEVRMIQSSFGFAMAELHAGAPALSPTIWPAAASWMSAAIRSRWRA